MSTRGNEESRPADRRAVLPSIPAEAELLALSERLARLRADRDEAEREQHEAAVRFRAAAPQQTLSVGSKMSIDILVLG
jgi:hypothetical protein